MCAQDTFSSAPRRTETPQNRPCPCRAARGSAARVSTASPDFRFPQALLFFLPRLWAEYGILGTCSLPKRRAHVTGCRDQGVPPQSPPFLLGGAPTAGSTVRASSAPMCQNLTQNICLCSHPRAAAAGAVGDAGGEIRCSEPINAPDPRAVGPAQAKYEICISAFHFHMVFMGPPCRNKSKSLIQKPPSLADL